MIYKIKQQHFGEVIEREGIIFDTEEIASLSFKMRQDFLWGVKDLFKDILEECNCQNDIEYYSDLKKGIFVQDEDCDCHKKNKA